MRGALLAALLLTGCNDPVCYLAPNRAARLDVTAYPETEGRITPGGILLDDPLRELDDGQVDAIAQRTLECVRALPKWECPRGYRAGPPQTELKACLRIQVATNWRVDECSPEQKFPCAIGPGSCQMKGQSPDANCPCMCRAVIQQNRTVVITPNMKLLPAALTQLFSGCDHVWQGELATCAGG